MPSVNDSTCFHGVYKMFELAYHMTVHQKMRVRTHRCRRDVACHRNRDLFVGSMHKFRKCVACKYSLPELTVCVLALPVVAYTRKNTTRVCLCGYVHDDKLVLSPWSYPVCATPTP